MPLKRLKREEVLADPGTRQLVKDILALCKDKDIVDIWKDVSLVKDVVRDEMDEVLGR